MKKYTFEMSEDAKDKIEQIIKAFDLDVHINEVEQIKEEKSCVKEAWIYMVLLFVKLTLETME